MDKIVLERIVPQQSNHDQNGVAFVVFGFDKAWVADDLDLVVFLVEDRKSDVRVVHQGFRPQVPASHVIGICQ